MEHGDRAYDQTFIGSVTYASFLIGLLAFALGLAATAFLHSKLAGVVATSMGSVLIVYIRIGDETQQPQALSYEKWG